MLPLIVTAMLNVLSNVYIAADSGNVTLLSLVHLSAAFYSVDHQILISDCSVLLVCVTVHLTGCHHA